MKKPMRALHPSRPVALATALLAMAALDACTTSGKHEAAKTALDALPAQERRDDFEATARALSERPEYVDEFYAVARKHPALMSRFLANAAKDLQRRELAEMTAKLLVNEPASLEQTLVATIDHIVPNAEARNAMNRAIASRAGQTADILLDSPATLKQVTLGSLKVLEKKPAAKQHALRTVRESRGPILQFVLSDKALATDMTQELVKEAVKDKPALDKMLRAVKAVD